MCDSRCRVHRLVALADDIQGAYVVDDAEHRRLNMTDIERKYGGLWKSPSGWYVSSTIKKSDWKEMPKDFRLIIRQNKYWQSNKDETNRQRFIFRFADGRTADNLMESVKLSGMTNYEKIKTMDYDEMAQTLFSISEIISKELCNHCEKSYLPFQCTRGIDCVKQWLEQEADNDT